MNALLQSFEENSIIWILLSAGLGGISGALIDFLFKQVLTPQLQQRRRASQALRQYCNPLLGAADKLDRRLENLINFVDKEWFDNPEDDYYRVSTLYLVGCYFGWCKILEDEAFLEYEVSNKRARLFNIEFYSVFKAMTGFHYFKEVPTGELTPVEAATIPRLVLTAIGELMIEATPENGDALRVMTFTKFVRQLEESPEFQKWFAYVDRLLSHLKYDRRDARWNRIVVFASMLRGFIVFLDPEHRMTAPRDLTYLPYAHPLVSSYLQEEMDKIMRYRQTLG